MGKELYIYSSIYDYAAETANKQLSKVADSEDLTVRFNSPGGDVNAGFSILSKLHERKTDTIAIVDGQAKSMAAFMLPFFGYVLTNDTSELMFHKAAYPSWYEPTEQEQKSLKRTNAIFEQKMRTKVGNKPGGEKFLAELFEPDVRNDVELTPDQALSLGIVDEVRTLEPKAMHGAQIVAMVEEGEEIKAVTKPLSKQGDNHNPNTMSLTLKTLKEEHPAIYAQAVAEGVAQGEITGAKKEKARVQAWAVHFEADPEKVLKAIEEGTEIQMKDTQEFIMKGVKNGTLKMMEKENPETPEVPETPEAKTDEEKAKEAQKAEMDKLFGKKEDK